DQLRQVRQMGSLEQLVSMIPGVNKLVGGRELEAGEEELKHVDAIINSMTHEERQNPAVLNASRRRRIARGSGTSVEDVNRLVKQYQQLRRMMAELGKGRFRRMRGVGPF
ncbi:MAG: signal recognition particle protein, partial [Deltaproteobacteria bacterium]|nr:signal recognition particle protein [Deltaproteobacteria bacterium]